MLQVHSEQRRGAGLGRGDQAAGRHGGGGALTSLTPVQYSTVQYSTGGAPTRDDRIYSDSIRIRIFFRESRIFGFGFDNFLARILFEYSNLFPRISNI